MSLILTPAQIEELRTLRIAGKYADAYDRMAEWTRDSPDPDVQLVHTWLLGAGDINRGVGPFAALVKAYNQRQGELRGQPVSVEENQRASNYIAQLVIDSTLASGAIPDFTEIVDYDAEGGKYLYADLPDDGDTAKLNAANWTGTFLISPFGQDETDRLIQSGDSDVQMDTIDDLKNVLYSHNAFKEAILANFPGNGVRSSI